jgi:predicted permease
MSFREPKEPHENWERDLRDELDHHFEKQVEALIQGGVAPEEARRQAALQFGATEGVKEDCRAQRRGFWLDTLLADVRFALRMLRKNPGFTAIAILTLALGIGANTAIFSVLDGVILKPLSYSQPDRLALVWSELKPAGQSRVPSSAPDLADLKNRSRLLQRLGGIWVGSAALMGTGEPEQLKVGFVTDNFLSILGVSLAHGRMFTPEDNLKGASATVILTDGLWRRRFGANPQILGKQIRLDGQDVQGATVVGILAPDFKLLFPEDAAVPPDVQAFVPFRSDMAQEARDLGYLRSIAHLQPGATFEQAQAEAHTIADQLRGENTIDAKQGLDFQILPFQADSVRKIRPAVMTLFGGVGFVLLIACVNMANLLLSRGQVRQREMALRSALGAARGRVIRQLLTESILLSFLGGAAGLALGWAGTHWLLAARPKSLAALDAVSFDFTVLGYAFLIALVAGILFGVAPAMDLSCTGPLEILKSAGKGIVSGAGRVLTLLVAAEVALGFILLVGSGLLIRTFIRLLDVTTGFQSSHVLTFQITPPGSRYAKDEQRIRLIHDLSKNIATIPGVESVGGVNYIPFDGQLSWYSYYWEEGAPTPEQYKLMAEHRAIIPGYFRSMGVPLIVGRDFDEADDLTRRRVAIIDQALADRLWPNQNALGKALNVEAFAGGDFFRGTAEVIGVVGHIKYLLLTDDGRPQVYEPYAQAPREHFGFTVRTAGPPETLVGAVRGELGKLDPGIPLAKIVPMDEYIRQARSATRFTMLLAAALAALALLLASIGIYGVTSYSVSQRRNEMGIRIALGAQRRDVLKLVLSQGMGSVAAGLLSGLILSLLLMPAIRGLLFGVRPTDALTYAAVALFLSCVALLACYVPARRAMRVDPMTALRYE